ncbi:MAG: amino acid adenylation domain-containing protein [Clostridiales bacterium]|nr:amino acid adenylation domain-containing protein [Clostridiales bacterium]
MICSAVDILDGAARQFPGNIAIEGDKTRYTYLEYQSHAKKLATYILGRGIHGFVGVYLPKSTASLISFMGILYSGSAYAPLDISMPNARMLKILNHLGPAGVVTDVFHAEILISTFNINPGKIIIYEEALDTKIDEGLISNALLNVVDTDPIYVMYTSGSTGMPKGVVIPHRGVIDYTNWLVERFCLGQGAIFGNQAPFYFDNSVFDIYGAMKSGGKLVIIPETLFNFPVMLPEYILENKINLIFWVPTVLINIANANILSEIGLACLKKVLFCGEVMPNKQLNIWRKFQSHILYANLYGPTEITDVCTYYVVDREFDDNEPLPIGRPCENTKVLIINEAGKETVENEIGELCILGSGLALGYYNEPHLTANAFMQNPLNTKYRELIYRTGDLVLRNPEGLIMYLGRKDSQIKHKGNRIELGEIETMAQSLEEVDKACVLYDGANSQIVMFAELNCVVSDKALLKKMRGQLQSYMVPSKIIKLDKIPLNANGKMDRVYLKANYF